MPTDPKHVAIIGAGPSGLVAAKECLEAGLTSVVFEKHGDLGGVWNPNTGKVWQSMKTNLSRYHMGFSDLAWPENIGDYPTNKDVYTYLKNYAANFQIENHIAYSQSVKNICFNATSQKWHVETAKGIQKFKHVIMAGGVFSKNHIPEFKGSNQFDGAWMHAADYKNPDMYKDTRPVVMGGSFSAYEIAADLAAHNIPVTHVFRKPAMIITRYMKNDAQKTLPMDIISYVYHTPDHVSKQKLLNKRQEFFIKNFGNPGDTHEELRIDLMQEHFPTVISDTYRQYVESGIITPMKGDIQEFTKNGCTLTDQRHIHADTVIFCTGYDAVLPSTEKEFLNTLRYDANDRFQATISAQGIFHHDLPGFAMTGFYRGPYFGIMELQARTAAAVFSGKQEAPSRKQSREDTLKEMRIRQQKNRPPFPRGDYVGFMMELASRLDILPVDLLMEAHTKTTEMIPADFRRFGIGAKPAIAQQQRTLLLNRINGP